MSNNLKNENRQFYKSLFVIVAPMALQNLLSSLVNSLDVFMLGFVGQTALAAVSLANQVQFLMMLFYVGLSSGLIMLTSQYWGKRDFYSLKVLTGTALRLSAAAGFLFSFAVIVFPYEVMKVFTNETELISCGVMYLRIAGISYFFMAVSQVYQAMLKSIEHVKTSTATTIIALVLNMVLNATFIFGWFGLPKMGVQGIALATVIARGVELVVCLYAGYTIKEFKITPKCYFLFNKVLTKDFIKYSLPAVGNEFMWGAAFVTYSIILGHLGEDIVAANSVVNVLRNLASIMCFGMAYGGAILLGKQIGQGNLDLARRNSVRLIKSTIISGFAGAALILSLKPVLPYIAHLTPQAASLRDMILLINSYSLIGAAVNTVFICGVFRSGGDAKFGFFCDSISMWCVSVPAGLIAAFVFKLSPLWVYFILYLDEFIKIPAVIVHYLKGNWVKNITRDL